MKKTLAFSLVVFCIQCNFSPGKLDFDRAKKAEKKQKYEQALKFFQRVVKREQNTDLAIRAAKSGGRIALLRTKNYPLAANLYHHVIVNSDDALERINSQKVLAGIYFNHLGDYSKAVEHLNRLLPLLSPPESYEYRLRLAKAYFFKNDFFQSQAEIETLKSQKLDSNQLFSVLVLRGNVLLGEKKLDEAVEVFEDILSRYPEKARQQNVHLSLAVGYEEKKDFSKAIRVLAELRETYPAPGFIDMKIKRLKERQSYLPGARGLKK